MAKLSWSKAAIQDKIRKLEIKKGDILIIGHPDIYDQFQSLPTQHDFQVPLILDYGNKGIKALTRQQLLDSLDAIDNLNETEG